MAHAARQLAAAGRRRAVVSRCCDGRLSRCGCMVWPAGLQLQRQGERRTVRARSPRAHGTSLVYGCRGARRPSSAPPLPATFLRSPAARPNQSSSLERHATTLAAKPSPRLARLADRLSQRALCSARLTCIPTQPDAPAGSLHPDKLPAGFSSLSDALTRFVDVPSLAPSPRARFYLRALVAAIVAAALSTAAPLSSVRSAAPLSFAYLAAPWAAPWSVGGTIARALGGVVALLMLAWAAVLLCLGWRCLVPREQTPSRSGES